MIFRRISHRIALQFTAFVFLLFLVNGVVFIGADLGNAHRQMRFRLERMAEMVALRFEPGMMQMPMMPRGGGFPPHMMEQVRMLDSEGKTLFAGALFDDVPFQQRRTVSALMVGEQEYLVLTNPFMRDGRLAGYVQVADIARFPVADLPSRAFLYLLVSLIVSALTYVVGIFFARRSLKPAEEMMERLEQFTQDASHELRTPLAALNSSLDLALKTKKYREGITEAKVDVKQITALIERLLELTRLDSFHLQTQDVDVSKLVSETAEKFKPLAARRNIVLNVHAAEDVMVRGDPSLIRQILVNLLGNAVKFSKASGGTIRLILTEDSLSVEDEGVGMTAKDTPHIFDRFYQADSSRTDEGIGLGLALVKRIVDLHGWAIDVQSKKGKGSTFTIRFA